MSRSAWALINIWGGGSELPQKLRRAPTVSRCQGTGAQPLAVGHTEYAHYRQDGGTLGPWEAEEEK